MSRADFKHGWHCAVAEISRKLRECSESIDGSEAARIAESVGGNSNVGAQKCEVGDEILAALASSEGRRCLGNAEGKLFRLMRWGGQIKESHGVFRLTERGRSELL